MRIAIRLDPGDWTRLGAPLAAALRAAGHNIDIERARWQEPLPPSLSALLLLDRTLHSTSSKAANEPASEFESAASQPGDADLILDLAATLPTSSNVHVLTPLFDGSPQRSALWAAILDGRAPELSVLDSASGQHRPIGTPALEMPAHLDASAAMVVSRLAEGLVRIVNDGVAGRPLTYAPSAHAKLAKPRSAHFLATTLAAKTRRVLDRTLGSSPQWSVGWRAASQNFSLPQGPLSLQDWTFLKDDGNRYYADPFVIEHGGARHLFVEEFPYATRRGVISHTLIDASGRAARPATVLETDFHLSYPHIFEDDGEIFMLPECSASGRLTLYRAAEFPDRWEPVADLLTERVHDATLVRRDGRYVIFAATEWGGSSSWDGLSLFTAEKLLGPWQPHPRNPVLIDVTSARPGGAMFEHGGALIRPAQDCSGGYGSALTFARIDRLDDTGFTQTPLATWRSGRIGDPRIIGPHTYNCAAGLELIDLYAPRQVTVRYG